MRVSQCVLGVQAVKDIVDEPAQGVELVVIRCEGATGRLAASGISWPEKDFLFIKTSAKEKYGEWTQFHKELSIHHIIEGEK